MLTPGAVMSGLSQLSPVLGPPDVKVARPVPLGLGIAALVSVTVPPRPCGESAPMRFSGLVVSPAHGTVTGRQPRIPKNGIVTVNGIPVSGFEVICPSNGGNPESVLIIATAAAPACSPKIARATRAHVPRNVTTSLPTTPPG